MKIARLNKNLGAVRRRNVHIPLVDEKTAYRGADYASRATQWPKEMTLLFDPYHKHGPMSDAYTYCEDSGGWDKNDALPSPCKWPSHNSGWDFAFDVLQRAHTYTYPAVLKLREKFSTPQIYVTNWDQDILLFISHPYNNRKICVVYISALKKYPLYSIGRHILDPYPKFNGTRHVDDLRQI